jgi:hypothetical protein
VLPDGASAAQPPLARASIPQTWPFGPIARSSLVEFGRELIPQIKSGALEIDGMTNTQIAVAD